MMERIEKVDKCLKKIFNVWMVLLIIRVILYLLFKIHIIESGWEHLLSLESLAVINKVVGWFERTGIAVFVRSYLLGIPGLISWIVLRIIIKMIILELVKKGKKREKDKSISARIKVENKKEIVLPEKNIYRQYLFISYRERNELYDIGNEHYCRCQIGKSCYEFQEDKKGYNISVSKNGDYIGFVNEEYPEFRDEEDRELRIHLLTPTFKQRIGKHSFKVREAIAQDDSGNIFKVSKDNIRWDFKLETSDAHNGKHIYFRIVKNKFGKYIAYRETETGFDGDVIIEKCRVRRGDIVNGYPKEWSISIRLGSNVYDKTFTGADRVAFTEKSVARILPESGFYPASIVALVGPVGSGKTSFLRAVYSQSTRDNLKNMSEIANINVDAPLINACLPEPVRTPIGSRDIIGLKIDECLSGSICKTKGIIYFIDLSGELTIRSSAEQVGQVQFVASMAEVESRQKEEIIKNIITLADTMLLFHDATAFNGGRNAARGDNSNILTQVDKERIKMINVFTKCDLAGTTRMESNDHRVVISDKNQIWKPVSRVSAEKEISGKEVLYQNFALGQLICDSFVDEFYGDNPTFFVASGKPEGKDQFNYEDQVNVDALLAYLISQTFNMVVWDD